MKPVLFFNLSGPSGIGKTTTLRTLAENQAAFGLRLEFPIKVTTRAPKPADNPAEMTYVSDADYINLVTNGRMLVSFERHGNRYGFLHPEAYSKGAILIQAMPPAVSAELKERLSENMTIITMRLEADTAIVNARLTGRNDPISAEELLSRKNTALKPTPTGIDYLIDANAPPLIVAGRLAAIIKSYII